MVLGVHLEKMAEASELVSIFELSMYL